MYLTQHDSRLEHEARTHDTSRHDATRHDNSTARYNGAFGLDMTIAHKLDQLLSTNVPCAMCMCYRSVTVKLTHEHKLIEVYAYTYICMCRYYVCLPRPWHLITR